MSTKLPYLVSPGTVTKIFQKIKEARQPEIFTQDFLSTKLGFKGGNARPIIPLMKKMGFLSGDGKPTEFYAKFRNDDSSKWAMAQGMKTAYSELYDINEYAHALTRSELSGLVIQLTGLEKSNPIVTYAVSTYENLKAMADFEEDAPNEASKEIDIPHEEIVIESSEKGSNAQPSARQPSRTHVLNTDRVGMNLSYTINLNLPETTNIEVFNVIFKSLKENLLKDS